jgi:hypothetical protein
LFVIPQRSEGICFSTLRFVIPQASRVLHLRDGFIERDGGPPKICHPERSPKGAQSKDLHLLQGARLKRMLKEQFGGSTGLQAREIGAQKKGL